MAGFRLILIFLMCSPAVFSQVIEQSNFFWLRGGIGGFHEQRGAELGGVSLNLGINFFNQRTINSRNRVRTANDLVEIKLAGYANNGDEHTSALYYDLGILYGKAYGNIFMVNACAGVGILGGIYNAVELVPNPLGYSGYLLQTVSHNFSAFNVPIEAGFTINSPVIGIGLTGFANINKTRPMTGFCLTLQVGRITKFPPARNKLPENLTKL